MKAHKVHLPDKKSVGKWGETLAAEFLIDKGYEIVARNVHTPAGEIDLIMRKDGRLVFVEVKTRRGDAFGRPEESVTPAKQMHMENAAQSWLDAHPEEAGEWQLDVIAIHQSMMSNELEIVHLEGPLG